ncbi:hypothetical protein K9M79_03525 [Candidatus Woesearchaeota archaeon]|nr:hypothetical protein [Candidatus Woesearchaeota archaeon]
MTYIKSFPRTKDSTTHWVDIKLDDKEEQKVSAIHRNLNKNLYQQCLKDAAVILEKSEMKEFQTNIVQIATALFNKRSSHLVYSKDSYCREKLEA